MSAGAVNRAAVVIGGAALVAWIAGVLMLRREAPRSDDRMVAAAGGRPAPPAHDDDPVASHEPRRRSLRIESLPVGVPVRFVVGTALGARPVSVMVLEDAEPGARGSDADDTELADPGDEHPGAFWSNAGFGSLHEVADALGLEAQGAWSDSPSGELLLAVLDSAGGERLVSVSPDPVPGDINADETADLRDLALFLRWLGERHPWADLTEDGVTDGADLTSFLARWTVSR